MTDHKQQLQSQLWNIANDQRSNTVANEFCDYILGFIFLFEEGLIYVSLVPAHENMVFTFNGNGG